FSDGKTVTVPKGAKGDKGQDGTSVTITRTETDQAGNTVVHFSDGHSITVPKGQDGQNGTSITVTNTELDKDGNTVI
ncbi:hypothetical protein SHJJP8918_002427, partial [Staphylococcus lugdunensis]|nr:hypothetical protein [Staphylococcus lugdunensis]